MRPIKLSSPIGRLRLVAILEGISYLLLGITMPLKYKMGLTEPNYVVGMAHGLLFILYCVLCVQNTFIYRWSFKTFAFIMLASLIPFATFYADYKVFRRVG